MYTELKEGSDVKMIRKDSDLWIPIDSSNSDYQEYLSWVDAGNTPSEEQI